MEALWTEPHSKAALPKLMPPCPSYSPVFDTVDQPTLQYTQNPSRSKPPLGT